MGTAPRGGDLLAWMGIAGVAVLTDGLALAAFGTGAVAPPGAGVGWLPPLLLATGAALLAVGLAAAATGRAGGSGPWVPRLFPFATLGVQVGVYAAAVIAAVAVFQGTFETFTPAHGGGDLGAAAGGPAGIALVAAASAVLWVLTVYAVLVARRVIRLGRWMDRRTGADPYGAPSEPSGDPPLAVPRGSATGGVPVDRTRLTLVTLLLGFGASVAIQVLETATQPAPRGDWWWAQLALPVWCGFVASAVGWADRGVRDLERRYVAAVLNESLDDHGPRADG